eukprot:2643211-Amphidinium_carterae.1
MFHLGRDSGLATQTLRQLKLDGQSQKDIGDLRVRCGEAVEDLEHIVHHCLAWAALPASALEAPPCVKMACCLLRKGRLCLTMNRLWLPGLVFTQCGLTGLADTVVIHTFAGVELGTTRVYTDTGKSVFMPLPG